MELLSSVPAWRCIAIMGIVSRLTAGFGLLLNDQLPPESGINTEPGYTPASDLQTLASSFASATESQFVTTDTPVLVQWNTSSDTTPATIHPDHVLDAINVLQTYLANTKANTQAEPVSGLTSVLLGNTAGTPETGSVQDLESISNLLSQLSVGNAHSVSGSNNNNSNTTASTATDTVVLSSIFNTARNSHNTGINSNSNTFLNSVNVGGNPVQTLSEDTLANSGQTLTASVLSNASTPTPGLQSGGSDASLGSNTEYVVLNAELQHFPQFNPQQFNSQDPTQQHTFAQPGGATRNGPHSNSGPPHTLVMPQEHISGNPTGVQGFNVGQPPEPNLETFQPLFGNRIQGSNIPSRSVSGTSGTEGPLVQPNSGREQTQAVMPTNLEPNMNQRVNIINNQNNLGQIPQSVIFYRTPQGQLLRVTPYQGQQGVVPPSSPYPVQGNTPRVETSQRSGFNSQIRTRQIDRSNRRVPISAREQPAVDSQIQFAQMSHRNRMGNPYTVQRRRRIRPRQRHPYRMYPQRHRNIYPSYNSLPSRLYRPRYQEYPPLHQRGPESSQQVVPTNSGFRRVQSQSQPATIQQTAPMQARPGFTINGVGQRSSDIPRAPQRPLFQITSVNPVPPPRAGSTNPQGSPLQQQFGMLGSEGQAIR